MPKVDLETIEKVQRTGYPSPHDQPVRGRWAQRLGPLFGLSDFGGNVTTLEPGAWSSQRHWHEGEDELVVMLEGEATLVEDEGETLLQAGDIAVFPKGIANGHHFINRSDKPCRLIAIGKALGSVCHYSDIDMIVDPDRGYVHRDGTPF
jgi:uncharacterized cupin superfamily protein